MYVYIIYINVALPACFSLTTNENVLSLSLSQTDEIFTKAAPPGERHRNTAVLMGTNTDTESSHTEQK